ncbi:MAG: helix-turn-helix transcriptional regulator [Ekhidna sp.]|uniref:helix-turn-helix domain-containing protein n=1 Tax=Ekhidna sp. TaxID=2608089 RepID=UPI0032EF1FE1
MNLLFVTDEQIIKAFGKVLKELREANGLSQEALAHAIKSHATHISRLENGHKQPTLTTLFKIAEKLNVDPEKLILKIKSKSS